MKFASGSISVGSTPIQVFGGSSDVEAVSMSKGMRKGCFSYWIMESGIS